MDYYLALAAAVGCAVCNGSAVIFQKVGVNEDKTSWRLLENPAYLFGILLDIIGWLLTLLAVRILPLFLVQAIIAANIVITAMLEQVLLRRRLPRYGYRLIIVILIGLVSLAITAAPTHSVVAITVASQWTAVGGLVILGVLASLLMHHANRATSVILAVLSGVAFGAVSIVGRLLITNVAFWNLLAHPLTWILVAYSGFGILCFTLALRHATATTVNAVSVTMQTVVPAAIGLMLLGDSVRNGEWFLAAIALVVTLAASLTLASLRSTHIKRAMA